MRAVDAHPTFEWLDRRFSRREKLALGLEIASAYSRARWWLWRTDLPHTVSVLRGVRDSDGGPADPELAGARLGRAVGKMLTHLPLDSRCLMRSLVLTRLLARRGIESSLVIAVRSEPKFEAHAWVESRGGAALLAPAGPAFRRIVEI